MKKALLAASMFLATAGSLAAAEAGGTASTADALREFGMIGTMALNCHAPPSDRNPYVTYRVGPDGQVTREPQTGPTAEAKFRMRNAHRVGPDRLEYEETGRQSELKVLVARIDGRFRGWRSVRTSGPEAGAVLIDNGVITATGEPSAAFSFCHAN